MIEGLKLTFSGEELRTLLEVRIDHHRACAGRWAHETTRTSEDETEGTPLLPEHMCTNEAERHAWRADVLRFIRDHLEPAETYRLRAADLEIGEFLPSEPDGLAQEEYEERHRAGFALERIAKAVETLVATAPYCVWRHPSQEPADPPAPDIIDETGEYRTTRLDIRDGPEIVMIERRDHPE